MTMTWAGVTEDVARVAGQLARRFRRSHSGIDDVDYLIAATAIVTDAGLLTTNVPPLPDVRRGAASILTTYGRHHCRSGRAVSIPWSSSFVAST